MGKPVMQSYTVDGDKYPQFLVATQSYPGYWGRGDSLEEAVKAAQWIKSTDTVTLVRCTREASVSFCGQYMYGVDMTSAFTGTLRTVRRRFREWLAAGVRLTTARRA